MSKYEYYEGREVSTSSNKDNWPKCYECGSVNMSAKFTKCKKHICTTCYFKDKDGELE